MNMAYDGGGHLSEDDLVLHYYGEGTLPEVDAHLAGCDACRANLRALQRVLNVVDTLAVPERGAEYGAEVWAKIGGQLPRASRWGWLWKPRQWVWSGALAGLLVAAFFVGRWTKPEPAEVAVTGEAASGFDQRVLLTAVGNHLDRSQMVLIDLTHEEGAVASEVEDLLEANRLYRTSASQAGERQLEEVLDELERLLVEVAHLAPQLTPQASAELRQRIQGQGILLKVRITGSEIREREKLEF